MRYQRSLICLLLCAVLLIPAWVSAGPIYDAREDASGAPAFASEELLEVVFPSVAGGDACILRFGEETLLIDSGSTALARIGVLPALQAMGIDHIQTAMLTHPHDDHINGFPVLLEAGIQFDRLLVCQEETANYPLRHLVQTMRELGTEVVRLQHGDRMALGAAEIEFSLYQRSDFTMNDLSGIARVTYGDCAYLGTGDIENRAQKAAVEQPPESGFKADILKHPHHGYARINAELLAMIDPELVVVTGLKSEIGGAVKFLQRAGYTYLRPWPRALRFRTDGEIWILDYLPGVAPAE